MRNSLFLLVFLFVLVAGNFKALAQNKHTKTETSITTIQFNETEHDFGAIKQGKNVSYSFVFQNTGTQPLIIKSAKGSCGCTIPKYAKKPIAPGEWSEIVVKFKSANKDGSQTKTVTINANTNPNPTRLTIKADVIVGGINISN